MKKLGNNLGKMIKGPGHLAMYMIGVGPMDSHFLTVPQDYTKGQSIDHTLRNAALGLRVYT